MLDIAETLNPLLDIRTRRVQQDELDPDEDEDAAETTLQLVFFDGEEAFVYWSNTDSIYGARSVFFSSLVLSVETVCSYICILPQPPRQNLGDDLPPASSQAPSNVSLDANDSSLDDRALGPPRPPRRRSPSSALLLPRHRLAL
jgi:hypothetical protein